MMSNVVNNVVPNNVNSMTLSETSLNVTVASRERPTTARAQPAWRVDCQRNRSNDSNLSARHYDAYGSAASRLACMPDNSYGHQRRQQN